RAGRGGRARMPGVTPWRPMDRTLSGTPVRAMKDALVAQRRAQELRLEVLDARGVAEHLASRFPGVAVPEPVASRVQAACDGHPLFMQHAVGWLAEHGRLPARAGRLALDPEGEPLRVVLPESLHHLLTREVERLAGDEIDALEVASVAGADFSAATVACGLAREVIPTEALLERHV